VAQPRLDGGRARIEAFLASGLLDHDQKITSGGWFAGDLVVEIMRQCTSCKPSIADL